jgi:hypothetical protein
MNLHITDRALYDHLTGKWKLADKQLSHLAECAKCSEVAKIIKNLKKYIDAAEAKKNKGGGPTA